ncbi:MAG TPA: DUF1648 domain-containing protein [bacterium]|nr:DUF1648 domain-containing protein [bacterium]HMW36624.1 DUF1648 domain-containing protein [bacterium]HMZ03757.1 DUF1648 domain-containing protein [bacterium]HNC49098.1 DUF1648 domain-containing protein [bacterium]HND75783.1 DUF1648 domain-containing protein [bacterium]
MPRGPYEKWIEVICISVVVASFVLVMGHIQELPESIAIHFDWSGYPDNWGSKHTLWLLPALSALVIYMPLTVFSFLQQGHTKPDDISSTLIHRNFKIARISLALIKLNVLFLMWWLTYIVIQSALSGRIDHNPVGVLSIFLLILTLIIGISIYLVKAKRSKPSA